MLIVLAIILGVVCLERFYTSCRRTIARRRGRDGFSSLESDQRGHGGSGGQHGDYANPDADELQLTDQRGMHAVSGDDHL